MICRDSGLLSTPVLSWREPLSGIPVHIVLTGEQQVVPAVVGNWQAVVHVRCSSLQASCRRLLISTTAGGQQ
jgi:hypothetical protein